MRLSLSISVLLLVLASATAAQARTATVQPGETLADIARRELGDGNRWVELCDLNKATIANCNNVLVGTIVSLPDDSGDAESAEAEAPSVDTSSAVDTPPIDVLPSVQMLQPPVSADAGTVPAAAATEAADGPRENLLPFPQYFDDAGWSGYFTLPELSPGHVDPLGGSMATRLSSADAADSPGAVFSGIIRNGTLPPGVYTVGLWLRSVTGTQAVRFGLSDAYLSEPTFIDLNWQYVSARFDVTADTDRIFEVLEASPSNPAWEIFGASVELGESDVPFYSN
jgi:hypothetical protein